MSNRSLWIFSSLLLGLFSAGLVAATPGTVSGALDMRPSMAASGADSFHTENSVELGINLTEDINVSYLQAFNTNIARHRGDGTGLDLYAFDGFFRARFAPIWKSADESLTFTYAPRVFTPTFKARRDAGMITTVRNYFTLSKKVSSVVTVTGSIIPIFHAYSRTGSGSGTDASANPVFENRVYAIVDISLTDKLSLSLPLFFHQTRHLNYQAGAKNNDAWSLLVWTYPELLYAVTPKLTVGVAFYSDDLLKADGLGKGVGQLTLQASL